VVEEVTDEILSNLIEDHEFVAVFFRGECVGEDDDCDGVLAKLEAVDDELDEIGILLVSTPERGGSGTWNFGVACVDNVQKRWHGRHLWR
jgi:hypothetical protein